MGRDCASTRPGLTAEPIQASLVAHYDPPTWGATSQRLFGWQLDKGKQAMSELPVDAGGRLWSPSLDSFLVPEREYLRLYDRNGQRRLTEAEAEAQRAEALAERLRSLGIDPDQV